MNDPNSIQLAIEAAKELGLAQLVPTVYQDVLQPAAQETGKNLLVVAKAVGVAISPLKATVWGYEQASDYLKAQITAKLAHKPASEIRTPDPVVAGPVVMGMAFASEAPHLREMYANLLATAMHVPSASKAHPSFAAAIQQLSPEEAVILKKISELNGSPFIAFKGPLSPEPVDRPTCVKLQWRKFCEQCGITDAVIADAYRNNLIRMGILIENYELMMAGIYEASKPLAEGKAMKLTDYGKLFLEICVRGI
jgi:Abortive infection alpha